MELAATACAARAGASSDWIAHQRAASAGPAPTTAESNLSIEPSRPWIGALQGCPGGCTTRHGRRPPGTPPAVHPSVEPRRPSKLQIVAITQHHHSTTTRHRTNPRATTTITHAPVPQLHLHKHTLYTPDELAYQSARALRSPHGRAPSRPIRPSRAHPAIASCIALSKSARQRRPPPCSAYGGTTPCHSALPSDRVIEVLLHVY